MATMAWNEIVTLAVQAELGRVVDLDDVDADDLAEACRKVHGYVRSGRSDGGHGPWDLVAVAAVEDALAAYEAQEA